jgi:hypothetical protein
MARAQFNVPLDLSGKAQSLFAEATDSSVLIPSFFGGVRQMLNAQLFASAPVFGGTAFFSSRENAGLRIIATLGDARLDMDTTLEAGDLLLKGSVFMPLQADMRWRSLTFGYAFRPHERWSLGVQIHRHEVLASVAGDLQPDMVGRVSAEGIVFDIAYPSDQVFGLAQGQFQGSAWTPEIALRLGPVIATARMGAALEARGSMDIHYVVPFFIDADTFEPSVELPDSLLTSTNLRRLLGSETDERRWHFTESLIFRMPQSITLEYRALEERLRVSYSRVLGGFGVEALASLHDSEDSLALTSGGYLDAQLQPDHVMLVRWEGSRLRGALGAHTLNLNYRGRGGLLSGKLPLEIMGDPVSPILQGGILFGWPLQFSIDFQLTPLPGIFTGVAYAF